VDRKADYVLALKGNQSSLQEDVEVFVTEQKANGFGNTKISQHQTIDADHGRIEARGITVIHDVGWLQGRHDWPALNGIVIVESRREIDDKIELETRFYITSLMLSAALVGPMVREHWAVENGLHWVMDMIFRDDECRVRTDHAPANFTTIKHMALNLRIGQIGRIPIHDSGDHQVQPRGTKLLSLVTAIPAGLRRARRCSPIRPVALTPPRMRNAACGVIASCRAREGAVIAGWRSRCASAVGTCDRRSCPAASAYHSPTSVRDPARAEPEAGKDNGMTGVRGSFTLSVVCMTTGAMPSGWP
jgi:predicted transposase YbfD/YdcC